ncbi:MAG: PepSY domain-containing protein [Gammaproteobacteria bacterium]|nr:PepSY domain-containing protein [Gammaproteobacteria bacterium]
MKADGLKALTNAHAWVGLIISTVLFVVFFAGSLSLFRDNIDQWESGPHFANEQVASKVSLDQTIATVEQQYQIYMHDEVRIWLPSAQQPLINVTFAAELPDEQHQDHHLLLSSTSNTIVGDGERFDFANFLYGLHVDLHIDDVGKYLVGLVTLFFFVALISGVVIHWRKIITKFFMYRKDGSKDRLLDAHNLIGVMGLPFHIMYAFSGLVFNLLIIYQISYVIVLYNGDQEALFRDAGFVETHLDETKIKQPMVGLDQLMIKAKQALGNVEITRVSIEHFGDQSASVVFSGADPSQFSTRKEIKYHIATGEVLYKTLNNYDNTLRSGLSIIASLHFGNFAGYTIRLLFFLLGLGTCYIILTGNLMWIEKRAKQRKVNQFGLHLVKAMTSGGFIGVIFATAVGFIAARLLPVTMVERSDMIVNIFFACLLGAIISALLTKQQAQFSKLFCKLTALLLCAVPLLDWALLSNDILVMINLGKFDVIIVEAMLILLALGCWKFGSAINQETKVTIENEVTVSETI